MSANENNNDAMMNATGDALTAAHVPPALIMQHVDRMTRDDLERPQKIMFAIMHWFWVNNGKQIPPDPVLEDAFNIVMTYLDGLNAQGLFHPAAAGAA